MTSFPGQLTTRGLNGCMTFVWSLPPFYLQVFLKARVRVRAIFVLEEP